MSTVTAGPSAPVGIRRILFTGGGGAGSEAISRHWEGRYTTYFGDADPDGIAPSIPSERRVRLPFARDLAFVPEVFRVARELSIDLIVPGVDEELVPLAREADASPAPLLLPGTAFVQPMLDKLACARRIRDAGLTAPRTVPINQAGTLRFPLIAKPRFGRGSRGVRQIANAAELNAYIALSGVDDLDDLIAQDHIAGQEYTIFVAADRGGKLAAVIPVKVAIKRGITIRAETEFVPEIVTYLEEFHEHFRAAGVYNVQLMLTSERKVYPFEVNPRVSTTFCLAIATGFDPLAAFLDGHEGGVFTPSKQFVLKRSWLNSITPL